LYLVNSNTTTLANSLIALNTVTAGTGGNGAGSGQPGSPGSTSGPDVLGTAVSSDHDLIGNSSGFSGTPNNGDILDPDPSTIGLDPQGLQDHGGPTKTIALVSGPAIDAGNSDAVGLSSTDQRGFARIVGKGVDIGAYEVGASAATTDVSVSVSAVSSVVFGGQITYTLTVTNNSSSAQSNVTLINALPANTTLVSWSGPSGWSSDAPAAGSASGSVSAWIASLSANTSATFTLVVQPSSSATAGTVISDTAFVGPSTGDATPSDNSTSFQTTVTQATPTVSVSPVSITYGTALANSQLSGTATYTINGTSMDVPGSFSYTSDAGKVLNAKSTAYQESVTFTPKDTTDFATVTTSVAVTVSPATLTITAKDATKIQGEANPTFSVSYSGFVLAQGPSVLGGTLKFSTKATTNSPPGKYDITPSGLTSSNYKIQYKSGTLTVFSYSQATSQLQAQVDSAGLASGIQSSLDTQLQAASAFFQAKDKTDAVSQLKAFISHVSALKGKQIDATLANALIAAAQRIIKAVG
jgi:uncharacterized repeat protein (TIGR01451 family)